jgi:predicted dehydrogenase
MARLRWGIFGSGAISAKFAAGLRHAGADVTLIASRGDGGAILAAAIGSDAVVCSYERAAGMMHGRVDAVYIATPPALHRAHALACIAAGVPALVEKPLAAKPDEARAICEAARGSGVLVMEGMWTRFLPAVQRLRQLVLAGAIGTPHLVTGSFGQSYDVDAGHGNFDPVRGGGALAHLGYYPLSLGQFLFGDVVSAHAEGRMGSTGVDEDVAISLRYAGGVVGAFCTSLRAPAANGFAIHGTHGRIAIEGPIYRPWGLRIEAASPLARPSSGPGARIMLKEGHLWQRLGTLRARHRRPGKALFLPFAGNGYHYEALEMQQLILAGARDSPVMPLGQSVALCELVERLRARVHEGDRR